MLLTLALVILGSAIAVLFSQEFSKAFKAFFALPGVAWCVPIIAVTALVVVYESWLLWFLVRMKQALSWLSAQIASFLPLGNWAKPVANMFLLLTAALLPVLALEGWYRYKRYPSDNAGYLTGGFLWLFIALIISTP